MKSSEHELQRRCVTWLRYQYPWLGPLFFAVPNGGHRSKATAGRMKAEGQTAGVSDLILLVPSATSHSLSIEMKDKAVQSRPQKVYERFCRAAGSTYAVCHSLAEFQHTVRAHLASADAAMLARLAAEWQALKAEDTRRAQEQFNQLKNRKTT